MPGTCAAAGLPAGTADWLPAPACDEPGCWSGPATTQRTALRQVPPPPGRRCAAATAQGITLLPVSGYRSIDYQAGLVARKQARGLAAEQILRYSALPGHSEHHLGTVLDLHDGRGPPLEETFQDSPAFAWLRKHAGRYGFVLSYGRDNPWGIGYEPWHWRYLPAAAA